MLANKTGATRWVAHAPPRFLHARCNLPPRLDEGTEGGCAFPPTRWGDRGGSLNYHFAYGYGFFPRAAVMTIGGRAVAIDRAGDILHDACQLHGQHELG